MASYCGTWAEVSEYLLSCGSGKKLVTDIDVGSLSLCPDMSHITCINILLVRESYLVKYDVNE